MSSSRVVFRYTLYVFVALAVFCTIAVGVLTAEAQPAQKVKTAGQQFKNIKVLKNLPANQLMPLMRKISASLGVRCDFCHVVGTDHSGFEKDDKKEKLTARSMLVMVQNLNKKEKAVDGKVTCMMCHRGKPEPDTSTVNTESN